jgi:hypothetical protein
MIKFIEQADLFSSYHGTALNKSAYQKISFSNVVNSCSLDLINLPPYQEHNNILFSEFFGVREIEIDNVCSVLT